MGVDAKKIRSRNNASGGRYTTLGRESERKYPVLFRQGVISLYVPAQQIPTKVILDGLKRNMSRGNFLSDELDLSSVLGGTRAYLSSPVLG